MDGAFEEVMTLLETRLHRAPADLRNQFSIDTHRNHNRNWTATVTRVFDGKQFHGFDGLGPSFEKGPTAALKHILSKIEEE